MSSVVKAVPEFLYIAMIDSLRQQFYPRMRQAGQDRKISDSHRKGYSCPMCENDLDHIIRNIDSKTGLGLFHKPISAYLAFRETLLQGISSCMVSYRVIMVMGWFIIKG